MMGLVAGLALAAGSALACNCPKEAMLKLNGTVSMVPSNPQQSGQQQAVPAPAIDPLAINPLAISPLPPQPADASVRPAGQNPIPQQ